MTLTLTPSLVHVTSESGIPSKSESSAHTNPPHASQDENPGWHWSKEFGDYSVAWWLALRAASFNPIKFRRWLCALRMSIGSNCVTTSSSLKYAIIPIQVLIVVWRWMLHKFTKWDTRPPPSRLKLFQLTPTRRHSWDFYIDHLKVRKAFPVLANTKLFCLPHYAGGIMIMWVIGMRRPTRWE